MRRLIVSGTVAAALVAVAAAAPAVGSPAHGSNVSQSRASPTVELMVVGRTRTLLAPRVVRPYGRTITVGRRRCPVSAGTPLAGLLASGLPTRVTDAGGCDPTLLFVRQVRSEQNHGFAGWEYKVGNVSSSFGAGDPAQRLRSGTRLLWFWCLRATACQHTLALKPSAAAPAAGAPFTVTVLGYDDNGRARPVRGATVRLGGEAVTSGAGGLATLTAPGQPGRYAITAVKSGLVPSFALEVQVR